MVGSDVVMTDSLAFSDVVLPASSHFEHDDLFAAYGQHWLQRAEPVIPPQGEALPNIEIFRRLAARFGFTDAFFTATDAELMDEAVDPADPRLSGHRPSRIPTDHALPMTVNGGDAVLFQNVFPKTPSGKVELASGYLAKKYGARLPTYRPNEASFSLTLISPASDERITSTFGGVNGQETPPLEMHPDDARARSGRRPAVRVWNDLGEVHLTLRVTDVVPPGVVSSLKGAWFQTSDNGQTVSASGPRPPRRHLGGRLLQRRPRRGGVTHQPSEERCDGIARGSQRRPDDRRELVHPTEPGRRQDPDRPLQPLARAVVSGRGRPRAVLAEHDSSTTRCASTATTRR